MNRKKEKKIHKFLIITNHNKDPEGEYSLSILDYIRNEKNKECEFLFCRDKTNSKENLFKSVADIPRGTDCILVIGGDGTMLEIARRTVTTQIPLVGINLGTLGYLTEIGKESVKIAIDRLIAGQYSIEQRMMLIGNVYHKDELVVSDMAVNDIVMSKPDNESVITVDIKVNGSELNSYRADGVIVSTATGSTGYSLSAGGPVIAPDARLFVITPVSPHTMVNRSIILRPENRIKLKRGLNTDGFAGEAVVLFDGVQKFRITSGDSVEIVKSKIYVPIVKIFKSSFVYTLNQKMGQ